MLDIKNLSSIFRDVIEEDLLHFNASRAAKQILAYVPDLLHGVSALDIVSDLEYALVSVQAENDLNEADFESLVCDFVAELSTLSEQAKYYDLASELDQFLQFYHYLNDGDEDAMHPNTAVVTME